MTPDMTVGIIQTLPLKLNTQSKQSPPEDNRTGSPNSDAGLTKESKPVIVDSVSITSQLQQVKSDVKKEETKKDSANIVINNDRSESPAAKVEFVYDLNGDLITKYMDSSNRLIYQTPPELLLRLQQTSMKSDSSVDTKA
jgi:hypothetical protein